MDIVIPLGKGSKTENLELRYCLRSIEKFIPGRGNVFIIGEYPAFLNNVIHIPATDINERHFKQRNICKKLLLACDDKRVSDNFVWASDDHVLLKPYDHEYYYESTLEGALQHFTIHQTYRFTAANTFDRLNGGHDYCHSPFLINKEKFKLAMAFVDWNEAWGYAIKSLYCGLNGITGRKYKDLKIKCPAKSAKIITMINDRLFFSYSDEGFSSEMKGVLNFLYPNKSIYEND